MKSMRFFREMFHKLLIFIVILFFSAVWAEDSYGQYFGRNKPDYKVFEYSVYQTPHFEIYHYFKNDSVLHQIALYSEEWYQRHQRIFKDTFKTRNPIIIYENHADFQQTTAISGNIGIGTGGVTEALKNRVVLPVMESAASTSHVLGHEMVHAFQFHLLTSGDSTSLRSIRNLPLWLVEGMAEYMSIGSVDPNTAMWMRDAVLNDDFPSLRDMTLTGKYFPYRFGQAFWAFATKMWGDTIIAPLYNATATRGYEMALREVIGYSPETFSTMWKSATYTHFKKFLKDTIDRPSGKKIFSPENAGYINLAPMLSPDGKYVAFLSEKDVFTLDLYLADAETGKIIRKLGSTTRSNTIDDFSYVESAATWSPDGKQVAMVIFKKGKNQILTIDVERPNNQKIYIVPGVEAFKNLAWSPGGESILVSGLNQGISDLYQFFPKTSKVARLTNDPWANLQPAWSSDGKQILFVTDKPASGNDSIPYGQYNLALYDLNTKKYEVLPVFNGADNTNPLFSPDNQSVYFLSTSDGFRNLYRYDLTSQKVFRLTDIMTGISGITPLSPAVSVARDTNVFVYSHFNNREYIVYRALPEDFNPVEVASDEIHFDAATLPPLTRFSVDIVEKNMKNHEIKPGSKDTAQFQEKPYRPRFQLDYIGNTGVGVGHSRLGTAMAGSVEMLFSDIVGNNQIYAGLAVNGEIYDFGGQFAYINNKQKIDWGVSISHIPYQYGYRGFGTLDTLPVIVEYLDIYRIFQDRFSLFSFLPLNQTQRFEFGVSQTFIYYRRDRYNRYYNEYGQYMGEDRERNLSAPAGFNIRELDVAYTLDNSYFGIASPLRGQRGRIDVGKYFGKWKFYSFLFDYRKYFYMNPITLAFRIYHYGRYGSTSENYLNPLFIGYPWLIRGYDDNYIYENYVDGNSNTFGYLQLSGSRIAIGNVEIRLPFTGPEKLSSFKSKFLFTELNLFADAGLAWDSDNLPAFKLQTSNQNERIPVFSAGASLRINVLGYLVLEPYYAIPLNGGGIKTASFGLNFLPGW